MDSSVEPATPPESASAGTAAVAAPTFAEACRLWLKLGFISFGGPTGQIAMMHAEVVEKRRWVDESRFLHALNFCVLLPGPEAQQLSIYLGWLLHRTRGGIVAGSLFVLPSAVLLWILSFVYVTYGDVGWLRAAFDGLKPAVLAVVAAAVLRLGQKILRHTAHWLVAALAFVALAFGHVPFPVVVLGAGLLGFLLGRVQPALLVPSQLHPGANAVLHENSGTPTHAYPSWGRSLKVAGIGLTLWWSPVLLLGATLGWRHPLFQQGVFFSKAALVTFGGAYAVLPYVSQQAVETYGWLAPGQMLDGLGLAETTPGPLIMVLQFVGFLGGWKFPEPFSPLLSATLGAAITTWTTFVPCFLWIFLGAPYIERLRGNTHWTAALSTITAAVVGVILNLAIWFGAHVLWPTGRPFNGFGAVVALVAFIGLTRWRWNLGLVILGAAALGAGFHALQ